MKLSIIVPAFNVEDYIGECIDSLLNQGLSAEEYEIIVVDDGSSDGTTTIVDCYCSRYSNVELITQKNERVSVARNNALDISTGNYVLYVDADDMLVRNSLRTLCDYIIENELDFLGFGMKEIYEREKEWVFDNSLHVIAKGTGNEIIESHDYSNGPWWYIFRKEKDKDLRFVPGAYVQDALYTPRIILMMDKCVVISNEVYLWFRHSSSVTKTKSYAMNKEFFEAWMNGVESLNDLFAEFSLSNQSLKKLRTRQESFLFHGIIRFLRLHSNFSVIDEAIDKFSFKGYEVYPMKNYKGHNIQTKAILLMVNNIFLFRMLNYVNAKLRIIK